MHKSEKWKWNCSVMYDFLQPHGLQPTRILRPWECSGKSTGEGCHCLLQETTYMSINRWMNKEDVICIHTYTQKHIHNEVLLSYKKNEILPFVITWMELWRYCAKWNKSDREKRNTVQFHLYINPKQTNKPPSSDTQDILMVARGGGWGRRVMGVKRCKSLSYAVNKSWGCNIQHGDYS